MSIEKPLNSSCVFIGKFLPKNFQPFWYKANKLVRDNEAETAIFGIVSPEITNFVIAGITITITQDRMSFETEDESKFEALNDLASGTIECANDIKINMFGINMSGHVRVSSEEKLKDFFKRNINLKVLDDVIKNPYTNTFEFIGDNPFTQDGWVRIVLQISRILNPGIFFHVNNHHDVTKKENGIEIAKEILGKNRKQIVEFQNIIRDRIISKIGV